MVRWRGSNIKDQLQRSLEALTVHSPFFKELSFWVMGFLGFALSSTVLNIKPLLLDRKGKYDFLEVGCGQGELLVYLSRTYANAHITGFDINGVKIAALQNYCRARKVLNITAVRQSVLELDPCYERKFDVVFANNILEHVGDDDAALRNMHAMLKPGGKLFILVPCLKTRAVIFPMFYDDLSARLPDHIRGGYSVEGLRDKLLRQGFKIESTRFLFGLYGTIGLELSLFLCNDVFLIRETRLSNIRACLGFVLLPLYIVLIPVIRFLFFVDSLMDNVWGNEIFFMARREL